METCNTSAFFDNLWYDCIGLTYSAGYRLWLKLEITQEKLMLDHTIHFTRKEWKIKVSLEQLRTEYSMVYVGLTRSVDYTCVWKTPRKTMLDPNIRRDLEKSLLGDVITIGGLTWPTSTHVAVQKQQQQKDTIIDPPQWIKQNVSSRIAMTTMKEYLVYSKFEDPSIPKHQQPSATFGNHGKPSLPTPRGPSSKICCVAIHILHD